MLLQPLLLLLPIAGLAPRKYYGVLAGRGNLPRSGVIPPLYSNSVP